MSSERQRRERVAVHRAAGKLSQEHIWVKSVPGFPRLRAALTACIQLPTYRRQPDNRVLGLQYGRVSRQTCATTDCHGTL